MIRINLAPAGVRPRIGLRLRVPALTLNLGVVFGLLGVLAIVGIGFTWWNLARAEARLITEVDQMSKELATLKTMLGQAGDARKRLEELKQRVETITALTRDRDRPVRLLDVFVDVVPKDLWLTGFEATDSTLKISGMAFSTTAVADFMANLRRSGKFKEVDIVIARQDLAKSPRQVSFEVTCRFDG